MHRIKKMPLMILFITVLMTSCAPSPNKPTLSATASPVTVIIGATVIDVVDGQLLEDHLVVIQDGLITEVTAHDSYSMPASAKVIDAAGQYLLPGLVDMHVHVEHSSELTLYPAYGVTSVFNLAGYPRHLRWRQQIQDGALFGPQLFTTGDYIDGHPATFETMLSTDTPADAAAAVQQQLDQGYDAVKVYSRLTSDQLAAVVSAAKQRGKPVIGHSGSKYELTDMIDSGQRVIAHGEEITRYIGSEPTEAVIQDMAQQINQAEMWLIPNLVLVNNLGIGHQNIDAINDLETSAYLHPAVFQPWKKTNNRNIRRSEEWANITRQATKTIKQLVKIMVDGDGLIMAGTDASTVWAHPGHSLINELVQLVDAGLTPHQAIKAATVNPARFIQQNIHPQLKMGIIKPGHRADLMLVTENPLTDIKAMFQIQGVMLNGNWHDREALNQRLASLEANNQEIQPTADEFEAAILKGDYATARVLWDAFKAVDNEPLLAQHYWLYYLGYRWLFGEQGFTDDPVQLNQALQHYLIYSEMFPEYHVGYQTLASIYLARKEYENSLAAITQADRIHPHNPHTRKIKAQVLKAMGE